MNHEETPRKEYQWMPTPTPMETLRDRFAMAVLSGICTVNSDSFAYYSRMAYRYADAMLQEKHAYEQEQLRLAAERA